MEQHTLFSKNTIHHIQVYNEAGQQESKTDQAVGKITPTQKVAIQAICKEHNIKEAAFVRDALDSHIELFPYKHTIKKHKDLLIQFLQSLR